MRSVDDLLTLVAIIAGSVCIVLIMIGGVYGVIQLFSRYDWYLSLAKVAGISGTACCMLMFIRELE